MRTVDDGARFSIISVLGPFTRGKIRRVLHRTRLIYPRINGPIISGSKSNIQVKISRIRAQVLADRPVRFSLLIKINLEGRVDILGPLCVFWDFQEMSSPEFFLLRVAYLVPMRFSWRGRANFKGVHIVSCDGQQEAEVNSGAPGN